MKELDKVRLRIGDIPAVLWGKKSDQLYIAVHGNMSHKEDTVIQIFAEKVCSMGAQVLSFDLPEHGDRKQEKRQCDPLNCTEDLTEIMSYAKKDWKKIGLFACSMGAYFSLLAYGKENLTDCYFLSPVVDMRRVIENMLKWSQVTVKDLEDRKTIETSFGQTLYWDYYSYVVAHPITEWGSSTFILYGDQDNTCDQDTEEIFAQHFHSDLTIIPGEEHYFHTEEQLQTLKNWLNEKVK